MTNTRDALLRLWILWALTSTILTAPLGAELLCNGPPEDFGQGLPPDWTVVDGAGGGLLWADIAGCGEGGNFTGGNGDAACTSSDSASIGAFSARSQK